MGKLNIYFAGMVKNFLINIVIIIIKIIIIIKTVYNNNNINCL